MSPLRRWMAEHGRPSWYSWLVVVIVPVMAATGVLIISLDVNERSIARERAARQATEQAFCGIITLLDDTYRQAPPTTAAGRELASRVKSARAAYNCPAA